MEILYEILTLIFLAIFVSFIQHVMQRKKHPPGPLGLPFVGYLPFKIARMFFSNLLPKITPERYNRQMKEKYGDIWSIDLVNERRIVLASLDVITEALIENNKLFSGRAPHKNFQIMSEDRGIIYADGDIWKNNRRFSIKSLRDLGMGKQRLESKISNEADILIEIIEMSLGKPTESPAIFTKALSNVISQLLFNNRNKKNDPELECFIENLKGISHSNKAKDILALFPREFPVKYTRKLFPAVDKFINNNKECMRIIGDKCRNRKEENIKEEYSKPSCVFDYFWRYRYQDSPEIDEKEKFLDISHSMFDLFFGGSDTTTNFLAYSCLILGQYKDIEEELRTEITSVVDDYKLINMDMRKDFPKLQSFIDEVHRYAYLVSIIHRRVVKRCIFRGYEIRPTDMIYADLATIMRDPNLFVNPDDFNLYRFMDDTRTKYIPNKALIPFGMGKRVCLGENISAMEIFIFLSKLIHKFTISLPDQTKNTLSSIFDGSTGIMHAPLDHEIIFQLTAI